MRNQIEASRRVPIIDPHGRMRSKAAGSIERRLVRGWRLPPPIPVAEQAVRVPPPGWARVEYERKLRAASVARLINLGGGDFKRRIRALDDIATLRDLGDRLKRMKRVSGKRKAVSVRLKALEP